MGQTSRRRRTPPLAGSDPSAHHARSATTLVAGFTCLGDDPRWHRLPGRTATTGPCVCAWEKRRGRVKLHPADRSPCFHTVRRFKGWSEVTPTGLFFFYPVLSTSPITILPLPPRNNPQHPARRVEID